MVIHDFVMPQTCNTKLLHGLCRYLLLLKSYLAINDYFVFLFRGVWRPYLLLFVFLCICFLVPLDLFFFFQSQSLLIILEFSGGFSQAESRHKRARSYTRTHLAAPKHKRGEWAKRRVLPLLQSTLWCFRSCVLQKITP